MDNTEGETPYLLKQNVDCRYLHILTFVPEFIPGEGILLGKTVNLSEVGCVCLSLAGRKKE